MKALLSIATAACADKHHILMAWRVRESPWRGGQHGPACVVLSPRGGSYEGVGADAVLCGVGGQIGERGVIGHILLGIEAQLHVCLKEMDVE